MPTSVVIPGVQTVHQRQDWEPVGYRMDTDFTKTPSRLNLGLIDRIVWHYTAAINLPDGDVNEHAGQIGPYLAAITRDYLTNRTGGNYTRKSDGRVFPGFPIGYSFAVDAWGGAWVLRGFDFFPAATGGHNGHTLPILFLTDIANRANELMLATARNIGREARRRGAPVADDPWSHGWFAERGLGGTPTGCCGDPIEAQIRAGQGNLSYNEGDRDMNTLARPERVYDSRPIGQPFKHGETRMIAVGMSNEAQVQVTAVGDPGASGHFSVNDPTGATAIIGFNGDDRVEYGGPAPVVTPNGTITLTCFGGPAHAAVDVYARG